MALPIVVQIPYSERLLLDEQAAADLLMVSVKTLRKLPIPRTRVLSLVRYRRMDLEAYVRALC